MSKEEDAEVAALPAYEGSHEHTREKAPEGAAILGSVERAEEYGYVARGYVSLSLSV